jgi:hypothetical protein
MIQPNLPEDPATEAEPRVGRTAEHDSRPLAELVRELRDETTDLLRQEVELVKAETTEKASRIARNLTYMAAGGLIAFGGLMFLLWAVTYGLMIALGEGGVSQDIAPWLAPLITGLILAILGGAFMAKAAATLGSESLMPRHTLRSIQENKRWLTAKL